MVSINDVNNPRKYFKHDKNFDLYENNCFKSGENGCFIDYNLLEKHKRIWQILLVFNSFLIYPNRL